MGPLAYTVTVSEQKASLLLSVWLSVPNDHFNTWQLRTSSSKFLYSHLPLHTLSTCITAIVYIDMSLIYLNQGQFLEGRTSICLYKPHNIQLTTYSEHIFMERINIYDIPEVVYVENTLKRRERRDRNNMI